jgi:hypothetical protein
MNPTCRHCFKVRFIFVFPVNENTFYKILYTITSLVYDRDFMSAGKQVRIGKGFVKKKKNPKCTVRRTRRGNDVRVRTGKRFSRNINPRNGFGQTSRGSAPIRTGDENRATVFRGSRCATVDTGDIHAGRNTRVWHRIGSAVSHRTRLAGGAIR